MPSMPLRHCAVTCGRTARADVWYSTDWFAIRMIQVHTARGRCQWTGSSRRKAASRVLRRPVMTRCVMFESSLAAMNTSSMEANPYFWICACTLCHCFPCRLQANSMLRSAKASYTVCTQAVRMAHQRFRQRTMYWPKMNTATMLTFPVRWSRGVKSIRSRSSTFPPVAARVRRQAANAMSAMTKMFLYMTLPSMLIRVPKWNSVTIAPFLTSSCMLYRRIFGAPLNPLTTIINQSEATLLSSIKFFKLHCCC
mmetsp:Transcript_46718/g.144677  ORF Transcript_46718/g.144677 Transcript_46718/m.144677 type:complete len:253 (+) Transcript_46718:506-1264(+)